MENANVGMPHRCRSVLTRPSLVALLAAALVGCNPVKEDKMSDTLQDALNGYQKALRWGYFDNAFAYLDPKQRNDKPMPAVLEGLRLTGYDVIQPAVVKEEKMTAMQLVEIEYVYEDQQVVKKLKDRQIWHYDEKKKSWWLESGLPNFK